MTRLQRLKCRHTEAAREYRRAMWAEVVAQNRIGRARERLEMWRVRVLAEAARRAKR